MAYNVCIERLGEATIVAVSGRIDTAAAFDIKRTLAREISYRPRQVILDCTGVDYANSGGLGTLLSGLEATGGASVAMKLCCGDGFVRHVLDVIGVTSLVDIFRSAQMALGFPADQIFHDPRTVTA